MTVSEHGTEALADLADAMGIPACDYRVFECRAEPGQ
jgi:hypothetical protein